MSELLIRSTYFPADPLSERRWLRHIAGRDLNLDEVNKSTIIGAVIADAYEKDPDQTVTMIKELYEDNPLLMENVIGASNLKKII